MSPRSLSWLTRLLGCSLFLVLFGLAARPAHAAADPVEDLNRALKLLTKEGRLEPYRERIKADIDKLLTISQLRRAYFIKDWSVTKVLKPGDRIEVLGLHEGIGKKLVGAVEKGARSPDLDRKIAAAILIGEIADSEQPSEIPDLIERVKFARRFTDALIGSKNQPGLIQFNNLAVKQATLSALGKITPDPDQAIPVLESTLKKGELGPRRIAAYALRDLAKNSTYYSNGKEKMRAIDLVIRAASLSLNDEDEPVRGYALLAVFEAGSALLDAISASPRLTVEVNKKQVLDPGLMATLQTCQTANPRLLGSLRDPKLNVRLSAIEALNQVNTARVKLSQRLGDEGEKKVTRAELWKLHNIPDPLEGIIRTGLKDVAALLQADDVRLRRSAMQFLEMLEDQALPVLDDIAESLRDPDRFVRWSGARTIGALPPNKITSQAVRGLAHLVHDADPDVGLAAASAIEAIGSYAQEATGALGVVIGGVGEDSRSWDVENRLAAMRALVSIANMPSEGAYARVVAAYPRVIGSLSDSDPRVRREAAYTMGQLGTPGDPEVVQRALAALKAALRDDDGEVRLNASEAILVLAP